MRRARRWTAWARALKAYSGNDDALDSVAGAVGEINTRLGYTGDTLSEVTGQFLDFADITGQDVVGSVQLVTKVMNKWNVDASKLPNVLDDLAYAGQISGLSVTTLEQYPDYGRIVLAGAGPVAGERDRPAGSDGALWRRGNLYDHRHAHRCQEVCF